MGKLSKKFLVLGVLVVMSLVITLTVSAEPTGGKPDKFGWKPYRVEEDQSWSVLGEICNVKNWKYVLWRHNSRHHKLDASALLDNYQLAKGGIVFLPKTCSCFEDKEENVSLDHPVTAWTSVVVSTSGMVSYVVVNLWKQRGWTDGYQYDSWLQTEVVRLCAKYGNPTTGCNGWKTMRIYVPGTNVGPGAKDGFLYNGPPPGNPLTSP